MIGPAGTFAAPQVLDNPEDRITCTQCHNLRGDARCHAAVLGELPYAGKTYTPLQSTEHRCVCFVARASEPDQRPARVRWPFLFDGASR